MRIDRRDFYNVLNELSRVATTCDSVLRNVVMQLRENQLSITATDLTTQLTCKLPATGDEFAACLPAKILTRLIKPEGRGNAGTVELYPSDDQRSTVLLDETRTRLIGSDPVDFPPGNSPDLDWEPLTIWETKALRDSLGFILPASSKDDTRTNLCTVLLDEQFMVTTDGHRLHIADLPSPLSQSVLLPATAARTLYRLLSDSGIVCISRTGRFLRIQVGPWQLETQLVEERFPDYQQVIPASENRVTRITVDTQTLNKALARVGRISKEKKVKFCVNGLITLCTCDAELGEAEIEVPTIHNNHQGDDLIIGFDTAYLKDALATKAPTVEMSFADALAPMLIDVDGGRRAVVMPIRLE